MHIERLYMENSYRNYNYLVICQKTKQALLIDPYDGEQCLMHAKKLGVDITMVVNTHAHWDHTRGNTAVVKATKAKVFAHPTAVADIDSAEPLVPGSPIQVGVEVKLDVLDTPGHTMAHVCLFGQAKEPVLFSGDTLFSAGVGNCHNGGDPAVMYHTVTQTLYSLPKSTKVYAGHDYIENNLKFSLSREADNLDAKHLLNVVKKQAPLTRHVTTLEEEWLINPFFRLTNPRLVQQLKSEGVLKEENPAEVFLSLRAWRDKW